MTPVQKSLAYDAVVLMLALVVVAFTDGTAQTIAVIFVVVTLLKAPYDVWEARRHPSE